jgi:hypothetical protein
LKENVATQVQKIEITAVEIHRAYHATTLYPQKLELTLPTNGGRSLDIVRCSGGFCGDANKKICRSFGTGQYPDYPVKCRGRLTTLYNL